MDAKIGLTEMDIYHGHINPAEGAREQGLNF